MTFIKRTPDGDFTNETIGKIVGLSVLVVLFLAFLFTSFTIISPSEKGFYVTMGNITSGEIGSGVHFKIPLFQSIHVVDLRPIQDDFRVEVSSEGAITKDNQTIGATMNTFYRYRDGELIKMYSQVGEDKIESILKTSVFESFKQITGSYTIFDIAMKQEEIRTKTIELLKKTMAYLPIDLVDLKITNYDWSDEFDKQIQQTMERAQQVKQAEQDKLITEQNAQKEVVKAEAEKTAAITRAEAGKETARLNAEAKALEGDGIKKYNDSIRANEDLELKFRQLANDRARIDKWDGKYVPVNNYGPIPVQTGSIQGE